MPAEGDDDRLFLDREHRGMRCSRSRRAICGGIPLLPFGDRLGVDAMALGQGPQARLTMLYRSTDCLCRCGAPMENLAHSASLHSDDKNAPSNPGIKHLVDVAGERAGIRTLDLLIKRKQVP